MGAQIPDLSTAILRVITQRLELTPAWQLPYVVTGLANSLVACDRIFENASSEHQTKDSSDKALLIHKLRTQVSTFLHDQNIRSRWAAIVLIKAITEIGGWDILRGCGAWVRGLLSILGKPDPPSIKELAVITLARIFVLIQNHQSLIREITLSFLPNFITSCLSLLKLMGISGAGNKIKLHESLWITILEALCELLPHHPRLFRPFCNQIHALTLSSIAPTASHPHSQEAPDAQSNKWPTMSENTQKASRKLFVLLNTCAIKNSFANEWEGCLHGIIQVLHRTADKVFRSVYEDWEPNAVGTHHTANKAMSRVQPVKEIDKDPLKLPAWDGIHAGMERLDGLLQTLQVFITTMTPLDVKIALGVLSNAIDRLLSVLPPADERNNRSAQVTRINMEIPRDEREGLWIALSRVHLSALELLLFLITRLGQASASLAEVVLYQALWVIEAHKSCNNIRRVAYELISKVLEFHGSSISTYLPQPLSGCIKLCCEDLLSSGKNSSSKQTQLKTSSANSMNNGPTPIDADSYLNGPTELIEVAPIPNKLLASAANLLPLFLSKVPLNFFSFSLRTQLERTAILTKNKEAMLANVLNPYKKRSGSTEMTSIIPLLSRSFPQSSEVEALLRPRNSLTVPHAIDFSHSISENEHQSEQQVAQFDREEHLGVGDEIEFGEDLPSQLKASSKHVDIVYDFGKPTLDPKKPFDSTLSQLEAPETQFSNLEKKRSQEEFQENSSAIVKKVPPSIHVNHSEDCSPRKRVRLDLQSVPGDLSTERGSARVLQEEMHSGMADSLAQSPTVAAQSFKSIPKISEEEGESDESEFVMPTIDLESDTEDEED